MKTSNVTLLKKRIAYLEQREVDLIRDRDIYRTFITGEIKNQLANLKEGNYNPPEVLLKRYMKLLSDAQGPFYLGLS